MNGYYGLALMAVLEVPFYYAMTNAATAVVVVVLFRGTPHGKERARYSTVHTKDTEEQSLMIVSIHWMHCFSVLSHRTDVIIIITIIPWVRAFKGEPCVL